VKRSFRAGRSLGLPPGLARAIALMIALALTLAPARHAAASTTIPIRISVKVILNPSNSQRPSIRTTPYTPLQDSNIYDMADWANDSLMSGYWRGYRFAIDEIVNVGSVCAPCDSSNPSLWYGNVFDGNQMRDMERWAKNTPAYQWRTDAVNLYINWGHGNGAIASFPPPDNRSNDIVISGSRVWDPGFRLGFPGLIVHHEMGHYFSLPHPNGSLSDCCVPSACITDGDLIEDTLPDGPCFTLDSLSLWRYGQHFPMVNMAKQDSLVNVWNNNMAYLHYDQMFGPGEGYGHHFQTILTELQLDRWADTANGVRAPVRGGRTWFVSPIPCTLCFQDGSSTKPYRDISSALVGATAGDVILLRPGDYSWSPLLNQPVTLRATHAGYARITNP
jgi:hypothetical protein